MNGKQNIKTANWLIVLAGVWLIIAPFIRGFSGTALSLNDVITGIIIAFISLIAIGMPEEGTWLNWVSAILGVWIFVTPFFMMSLGNAGLWNNLIIGLITVALGVWGAATTSSSSSATTTRPARAPSGRRTPSRPTARTWPGWSTRRGRWSCGDGPGTPRCW